MNSNKEKVAMAEVAGQEKVSTETGSLYEHHKDFLSQLPANELRDRIACLDAAEKKSFGEVVLAEGLEVLKGVRIDEVGMVGSNLFSAYLNLKSAKESGDSLAIATAQKELDLALNVSSDEETSRGVIRKPNLAKLVEQVGTYDVNNGHLQYVDELGRVFVAPATELLMNTLEAVGYKRSEQWVGGSNGDFPASEEAISQLEYGAAAREAVDGVALLHKRLGSSAEETAAAIRAQIKLVEDGDSEYARRIRQRVVAMQQTLREIREGRLRSELSTPRLSSEGAAALQADEAERATPSGRER